MTTDAPQPDRSQPETISLLRSWHGGDREALHMLLERHLQWVEDRVRKRLGNELRKFGETGDFVQEAMVNVLENGPQFVIQDEDHFRRLLARIVENGLRSRARHQHQQRRDSRRERPLGSGTILSLDPPRIDQAHPSMQVDRDEQVAWVRLAVELMSPLDREVLSLKEVDGLTFKEVGERMSSTEDAVRMRYHRALPKLAIKVAALKAGRLQKLLEDDR